MEALRSIADPGASFAPLQRIRPYFQNRRMAGYVFRSDLSYLAYLRGGVPATSSADLEVSAKIGGAAQIIAVAAPAALERERAPKRVTKLDASFDWGACEVLTELGALADTVEQMKTEAANEAAGLASCDRIDIAREAIQRGNHSQACHQLQVILQATGGGAGAEVKDFRPYFLMGLIRLGSFGNTDAALVDLGKAETAFAQAARRAEQNHAYEATWAWLGAAWACYADGRIDDALAHARAASTPELENAEACFELAKFLIHANRLDEARPVLERALQLDPKYGLKAACDGDFAPYRDLLLACLDSVRLHARRRAKAALDLSARQRSALGVEPEDMEGLERDGDQLQTALVLVDAATKAFDEDTVSGYQRSAADAERAGDLLAGLINRYQKLRLTAVDTIQAVEREQAQVGHIEVGGYRLAELCSAELGQAADWLMQAQACGEARRFPALIQAECNALRARAALHAAVDRFRVRSMMRATDEKTEVERALAQPVRSHTRSEEAKTCALGAVLVGICPTGCIAGTSEGGVLTGAIIVEFLVSVAGLAAAGAVIGAMIAPWYDGENSARRQQLERRRRALDANIEQLRTFGVENALRNVEGTAVLVRQAGESPA